MHIPGSKTEDIVQYNECGMEPLLVEACFVETISEKIDLETLWCSAAALLPFHSPPSIQRTVHTRRTEGSRVVSIQFVSSASTVPMVQY